MWQVSDRQCHLGASSFRRPLGLPSLAPNSTPQATTARRRHPWGPAWPPRRPGCRGCRQACRLFPARSVGRRPCRATGARPRRRPLPMTRKKRGRRWRRWRTCSSRPPGQPAPTPFPTTGLAGPHPRNARGPPVNAFGSRAVPRSGSPSRGLCRLPSGRDGRGLTGPRRGPARNPLRGAQVFRIRQRDPSKRARNDCLQGCCQVLRLTEDCPCQAPRPPGKAPPLQSAARSAAPQMRSAPQAPHQRRLRPLR